MCKDCLRKFKQNGGVLKLLDMCPSCKEECLKVVLEKED